MKVQDTLSLYDRLGGIYNIAAIVDDFIDRVMVDRRLNANPDVDEAHHLVPPSAFKYVVTEMICWAAGGPHGYSGRSMSAEYRHIVISYQEWLAFSDDLAQVLDSFAVPHAERHELIAIVSAWSGTAEKRLYLQVPATHGKEPLIDAGLRLRQGAREAS